MTELTRIQWMERALVAEALLEERTQELEGLRADMEDLWDGRFDRLTPEEEVEIMRRSMMESPQWIVSKMQKLQIDPKGPKTHPPSPTRRNESDDFRRFQQHAPRLSIEGVQCEIMPDTGDFRLGFYYNSKEFASVVSRYEYERQRAGLDGRTRLADALAHHFRQELGLSQRDHEILRSRIGDAIVLMEKRRGG